MRRIIKKNDSDILTQGLKYSVGNTDRNRQIREILEEEQHGFCAYTEERLSSVFARDIDHFNPELKKSKGQDNYENWFVISTKLNRDKTTKWLKLQPVMHPTHPDFNKRIYYEDGYYQITDPNDEEVKNLIELLDLNNSALVNERQNHILFLEEMMKIQDVVDFLRRHPDLFRFPTAVETTFSVNLLPNA
jgi:uncharacterized protein (TIGR02646 family)